MLQRLFTGLPRQLANLAAIGTGLMLLVVFSNVVARFVFNKPFYWAEEVTAIAIVFVTMLPAALLWNEDRHIKLDISIGRPGSRFEQFKHLVVCAASVIFNGVLSWQAWKATSMIYKRGMHEPSLLGSPLWIVYSALFVGSAVLLLVGLRSLYLSTRDIWR
ncbi:MAG: TRAP transporter small permease subunit [Desulfovibrionaceae bacterium]|jgi:TRAP-type C4-dicarboxylate transport system permease small subunit|nr:TRAP transporter small permease subunit [Desulfovibrionaceae bacterium]